MTHEDAIKLLRAAGYRVTKPKPRIGKNQRFPVYVAMFKNGEVTRMTTYTSLEKLDFSRGDRLAKAALEVRASVRRDPSLLFTTIEKAWFEIDGVRLAA